MTSPYQGPFSEESPKSILIIGAAGVMAQSLMRILVKKYPQAKIYGVDSRDLSQKNKGKGISQNVYLEKIYYNRGHFEKLFRNQNFDLVYYIGRMSHPKISEHDEISKRLNLSIIETGRILDLSLKFKVKKIIVLSSFYVYGAQAENSVFIDEESPLKASFHHQAMREVVERDQVATNWMWRNQDEIEGIVLRPCNIIGKGINNAMNRYLSMPTILSPLDYHVNFQFIHEHDLANLLCFAAESIPKGLYNVAPDEFVSTDEIIQILERKRVPVLFSLITGILKIAKQLTLPIPSYLFDYLQYSCLISNKKISAYLPHDFFRFSTLKSIESIKE